VRQLKPGCILINVSRGGLVENAALTEGMESHQIGGVGMDVYENEAQ
jgi:D-lactate dehydrogenase